MSRRSWRLAPQERMLKIAFAGPARSGKTALIRHMTGETFDEKYSPTTTPFAKEIPYEVEGERLKLQIWDTPGDSQYASSAQNQDFMRDLHALVFVFDVNDEASASQLESKYESLVKYGQGVDPNVPLLLVGNKMDMDVARRQLDPQFGQEWKNSHNSCVAYLETSAATGVGVHDMLKQVAQAADDFESRKSEELARRAVAEIAMSPRATTGRRYVNYLVDETSASSDSESDVPPEEYKSAVSEISQQLGQAASLLEKGDFGGMIRRFMNPADLKALPPDYESKISPDRAMQLADLFRELQLMRPTVIKSSGVQVARYGVHDVEWVRQGDRWYLARM